MKVSLKNMKSFRLRFLNLEINKEISREIEENYKNILYDSSMIILYLYLSKNVKK